MLHLAIDYVVRQEETLFTLFSSNRGSSSRLHNSEITSRLSNNRIHK